jgi:hypothetical protein
MSNMALCIFIQLIPRMTSIPCPLSIIRLVLNILPNNSSGTFYTIRSASTRPSRVLIMYGAPEATSDNFAFLAHVEPIKSCDATESNNMMIGCSLKKNVPASTSSSMGITSMVVLLARPNCGAGPLCWPRCWFTMGARARDELSCFTWRQSWVKWPIFPQL